MGNRCVQALAFLCAAAACGPRQGAGSASRGGGDDHGSPGAGQAHARVIEVATGEDLFTGPFARGRVGDHRLENGIVAFVVDAPARPQSAAWSGGNVVDAGPDRPGAVDSLGQVTLMLGGDPARSAVYETATPGKAADGSAELILEGYDSRNPWLKVTTRYSLAPGARVLWIETTLSNEHELTDVVDFAVGDAVAWHGAEPSLPGLWTGAQGKFEAGWIAGIGEGTTYGYLSAEGGMWGESVGRSTLANVALVAVERESQASFRRAIVVVEGGSPADIADVAASIQGMDEPAAAPPAASPAGTLTISMAGGPVRVVLDGIGGTPDPVLGSACGGRTQGNVILVDGSGTVEVPAGKYDLWASRGPEHSLFREEIEIAAGAAVAIEPTITRVIATKGAVAADLHVHTLASLDSCLSASDRILSARAEGLEVAAVTDVNVVTDPGDHGSAILLLQGEELATDLSGQPVGRFGILPLAMDASEWDGGALPYRNVSVDDIMESARLAGPDPARPALVIVHEPRDPSAGYFALVGFDRSADRTAIESVVDLGFACMEVWSGKDVKEREASMLDWFRLLSLGHTPTALGGSGSLSAIGDEPGYPRTYLIVGTDDPAAAGASGVVQALADGAAVVSNGPFLTIQIGKTGVGGLAKKAGKSPKVAVHLEAAPWTRVDTIEILVDGKRFGEPIPVGKPPGGSTSADPQVLDASVTLKLAADAFVVALARGTVTYSPVLPERPAVTPWALTNPILVDANGNGIFDPPDAGG